MPLHTDARERDRVTAESDTGNGGGLRRLDRGRELVTSDRPQRTSFLHSSETSMCPR